MKKTLSKSICIAVTAISFFQVNVLAEENAGSLKTKKYNINQYTKTINILKSKGLHKTPEINLNPINTTLLDYDSAVIFLNYLRTGYKNHLEGKYSEALSVYNNLLNIERLPDYMKSFLQRQKPLAEANKAPLTAKDYLQLVASTIDPAAILIYATEGLIVDASNYTFKDKADSSAFTIIKQGLQYQKSGNKTAAVKTYSNIAYNVLLEKHYSNRAQKLKSLAEKGTYKPLSGMVIVLDAGHNYGGNYGAQAHGYNETELNMQVVQKLKTQLEAQGAQIVLTRSPGEKRYDDSSIELPRRVKLANSSNGDLFISIHHDSSTDKSANGSSTFYSSYKTGINNIAAYVVVQKATYLYTSSNNSTKAVYVQAGAKLNFIEQASNGFMVNYNGKKLFISSSNAMIYSASPSFQSLLSKDLALKTASYLSSGIGTKNRGITDRNLYVTKNTTMASILVEIGFISNYSEFSKISKSANQLKAANEITRAVIAIYGA